MKLGADHRRSSCDEFFWEGRRAWIAEGIFGNGCQDLLADPSSFPSRLLLPFRKLRKVSVMRGRSEARVIVAPEHSAFAEQHRTLGAQDYFLR